jgi:hypothetical protein
VYVGGDGGEGACGGGLAYRSMMDIIGATSTAAEAAPRKSAPSRSPRFLVFHFEVVSLPVLGSVAITGDGRARGAAATDAAAAANCDGLTASN